MVKQPKVFLMDEPLSNLDAKLRNSMRSELIELHKSLGTTFVYVTHDQVEAMAMADMIVLINKGKIMQKGNPRELYNDPDNTFTAQFMGTPPMNVFSCDGKIQMGFRPERAELSRTENGKAVYRSRLPTSAFSKARLIDTLLPQILPFGANAFGIFLLRQSFRQINPEVFEAARMDDAGEWKIMLKVALPMCRSSLIATMMFSVIGIWNSYFWPLVMTNSDKFRPLTLYVEKLKQDAEQGLQWNLIMAGNLILVVPILIIYCFGSKQIIKVFTYNAIK